jgi:hypothetical protein
MVEQWLIGAWWRAALLWSVAYISDYAFSIYNASLYRRGAHQYYEFEGSLELTPQFQDDIDNLRWFSPRFLRAFVLSNLTLVLVRWLGVDWADWPETFLFAFGGMMLLEAAVHLRHIRLLVLFMQLTTGQGIEGKIYQRRWLGYQASGWEFIAFAGLCLLLSIVTGSWFILGGAFMNAVTGVQHLRWGKQALSKSNEEPRNTLGP